MSVFVGDKELEPIGTESVTLKNWLGGWAGKVLIVYIGFVLLHVVYTFFRWGGEENAALISNVASLVLYFFPGVYAWRTSTNKELTPRSRHAWRFIAYGHAAYLAGAALWLYFESILGEQPFPSWADAGYLLYFPLMMVGLLMMVERMVSKEERIGFGLDLAIIMTGGTLVVWYFLLQPMIAAGDDDTLKTVLSVGYPVGDLVLLLGIVSIVLRRKTLAGHAAINLLLIGVVGNFIADFFFSYQSLQGTYQTGNWVDAVYTLACLPVVLGAHYSYLQGATGYAISSVPSKRAERSFLSLPYIAVLVSYAILITIEFYNEDLSHGIDIFVAAFLTLLVLARQFLFIRESWRASEAVNDLTDRIQGIYSAASDGIGVASFDGRFLEVNDACCEMTGYSREEFLSSIRYFDLLAEKCRSKANLAARSVAANGTAVEYEADFVRKDGTRFTALVTTYGVRSRTGETTSIAAIVHDITARKNMENRLREAEERWKLALRVNRDGIWDWDLANNTYYYSPRWREMFGFDADEEIVANTTEAGRFFHQDDRHLMEKISSAVKGGELPYFEIEFRHICKDGSYKWVRCRGEAIFDERSGKLTRVIGLNTDISERKRAESERAAIGAILKGASETSNLDELLDLIHRRVSDVIYAENFFVALYNKETKLFSMQFFLDKVDKKPPATTLEGTRSHFVFESGEAILLDETNTKQYEKEGKFRLVGSPPKYWLGVPLRTPNEVIGVLVVQSYDDAHRFESQDVDFLKAVGDQIAQAVERKLIEDRLRESSALLREAQRIAHVGSWEMDIASSKLKWSDELWQIFGLSPGEFDLSYDAFLSLLHQGDRESVKRAVDEALSSGSFSGLEHRIVQSDGTIRHLLANGELVRDEDGLPLKLIGSAQDITERKTAEMRMLLQTVALESAANGVVITDSSGTIEWVNPAFTTLTGYLPDEAIGSNPRILKSGKTQDDVYKNMWSAIAAGKVWQGEIVNRKKDGSLYDEEMTITPVDDGSGSIAHFIAIKRDITERKLAEAALRESEGQHRLLFESNPFSVYVYDIETLKFLAVNEAAVKHYGYSREEFLNDLTLKDIRPPEDADELVERVSKVRPDRDTVASPSRHQKKDGTLLNVEITSHYILFNGRPAEIVLVNDVTNRKLAEEQLRIFNERLQQSNRELQDFAYVASHDLQEPLRKVQTFADRLNTKYAERLDETGLDYLERMRNAASRMQTLIQDLLSFSRVTTKAQPFVKVDLDQIARDVLSDLEVKIEETQAEIELRDLPKIDADPSQMRQLIQNLVGNALKFRDPDVAPHICISATNGTSGDHGAQYTVTVEDNGIGFEEKYTEKIFTVFQRLHGRTDYEGSGIGLAVCRKIVERHRGTITAKSELGRGSKFIFTLPERQRTTDAN